METQWKTVFKLQKNLHTEHVSLEEMEITMVFLICPWSQCSRNGRFLSNVPLGNISTSPSPSEQTVSPGGEQGPHLCSTSPSHRTTNAPQEPPYLSLQVDCEGAPKLNSAEKCLKGHFKGAI